MTPLEALTAGKAVIANPADWTQHTYARDMEGRAVAFNSPDAVCFCTWGALGKATGKNPGSIMVPGEDLLMQAFEMKGANNVTSGNDNRDHSFVMECWTLAIELAAA